MNDFEHLCCRRLEALVYNAGRRGLSILAVDESDFSYFSLRAQMVDNDSTSMLRDILETREAAGIGVTIHEEIGILYCPFCGTKLSSWINENETYFRDLAKLDFGHLNEKREAK